MGSPGENREAFREKLRGLSDRYLIAVISAAMARCDLWSLGEASNVMAERKKEPA